MKRSMVISSILFSAILFGLTGAPAALAQKGCDFNIVGTWKAGSETSQKLYRFAPEGTLTILSSPGSEHSTEPMEIGKAAYTLDNSGAQRRITFTTHDGAGVLSTGITSMEIVSFDDRSFTTRAADSTTVQWVRDDPNKYFLILAGHSGTFYDKSGPTFPMLVRTDGHNTDIAAVGIYSIDGTRAFGNIPAATYKPFLRESKDPDDLMFRLEISGAQYERGMKTMREYSRRASEGALLYPDPFFNNILLAKEITEGLNLCRKTINLYALDWSFTDSISEQNTPSMMPLLYFRELKKLNLALHVPDQKFLQDAGLTAQQQHSGK